MFLSDLERICERFLVCVCVWPRVRERREEEVIFEVICMEEWEIMHGSPMGNSEVATKVNFSSYPLEFGPLGRGF